MLFRSERYCLSSPSASPALRQACAKPGSSSVAVKRSCRARRRACSYKDQENVALAMSSSPQVTTAPSLASGHLVLLSAHRGELSNESNIDPTRDSSSSVAVFLSMEIMMAFRQHLNTDPHHNKCSKIILSASNVECAVLQAYLDTTDRGEKDSKTLLIPSIEGNTSSAKVLTSLLRILVSIIK